MASVKQKAPWHLTARGRAVIRRDKKAKRLSQSYLAAIVAEIGIEDVIAVSRKAVEDAKDGDAKAREWLGKYVLGGGKIDLRDLSKPSILKRSV